MKTEPYQIVKRYRGQYQVFDQDGKDVSRQYVSLNAAMQIVIAHKLQGKALKDERLLRIAESVTTLTGQLMHNWMYEVMIRIDIPEMRAFMKRPSVFREFATEYHRRNVEARLNSLNEQL